MTRDFLEVSSIYLKTSRNILREMIQEMRPVATVPLFFQWEGDGPGVKWNDFRMLVPVVLLFGQGLLVMLDGFMLMTGRSGRQMTLEEKAAILVELCPEEFYLAVVIRRHLLNSPSGFSGESLIGRILEESSAFETPEMLMSGLKHPELSLDADSISVRYPCLVCSRDEMLTHMKQLCQDIDILIREASALRDVLWEDACGPPTEEETQ